MNRRLDRVHGFEEHFIRGRAKTTLREGLALAVMLARAYLEEHRTDHIHSLVRA